MNTQTFLSDGSNFSITSGTTSYLNPVGNVSIGNYLNLSNMAQIQQVKVAVFLVKRNEENEIISSTIIDELWIEKKPSKSIEFAVAKSLKGDYEPNEIVIKEIYTITF